MSASWDRLDVEGEPFRVVEGRVEREPDLVWWQAVGILLLVTGIGPIVLVQLAWWLVTGDRLGA